MRYERKIKFGEGIIFAAAVLVCIAVIIAAALLKRPAAELAYPVHDLPESFAALDKININTAPAEELDELPGVGEVLAQRIVSYREANGAFARAEDIMQVDGIGESLFSGMADMIIAGE